MAAEDVLKAEVELDDKNGVMIYEVEFETGTVEFEYEIDALTGATITSRAVTSGVNTALVVASEMQG